MNQPYNPSQQGNKQPDNKSASGKDYSKDKNKDKDKEQNEFGGSSGGDSQKSR